jgi:predicted ATPase
LLYTAPVFLWCGDLVAAREVLEKLMAHPNYHALPSFHVTALALHGELLIRSAEAESGVVSLRSALITMRADRQNLLLAHVTCALAEGLVSIGQHEEALAAICETQSAADAGAEVAELPELLRMRAEVLLSKPQADESEAEAYLVQALTVARRQSALSWELRIATSFARVRTRQRRLDEARQLLGAVYSRFTEGYATGDLKSARQLLTELDAAPLPMLPTAHPDQHGLGRPRSNHADANRAERRFT